MNIKSVLGIIPKDKQWNRMKDAYFSCKRAGIDPPEEVLEFFDYGEPDRDGSDVIVKFTEEHHTNKEIVVVHLKDIPEGVEIIKIVDEY